MKLCATRNKNHVAKKAQPKRVKREVAQEPAKKESDVLALKWDIGISEGVKRKKRSVSSASSKRLCKEVKSPDTTVAAAAASPPSITSVPPVEGCPIEDAMDDELLACVFMRLNMKDLSASMRTCKRWRRVACKEDIWEHIPLPTNVAGALPRSIRTLAWLCTAFGG